MQLTLTPEADLASTYPVRNSPLAEKYLAALSREGVTAEAVYLQDSPTVLTLYINSARTTATLPPESELFERFCEICDVSLKGHICIDYIDRLTLRHRLERALPPLNRSDEVIATGATLYCAFDSDGTPRPLAIFPSRPSEPDKIRERLAEILYNRLKPRELRGEITRESVTPRIAVWSQLTPEERFALARG